MSVPGRDPALLNAESEQATFEQRWMNQLVLANNGLEGPALAANNLVGMVAVGSSFVSVLAEQGRYSSERGLADDEMRSERQTECVPLIYTTIRDKYTCSSVVDKIKNTAVATLIRDNIALTTYNTDSEDGDTPSIFVLFTSTPINAPLTTRSGLLGRQKEGVALPLFMNVDGRPYAVELKGAGTSRGAMVSRTHGHFENITLGGLPKEDGWHEFHIMQRAHDAGLTPMIPLAVGEFEIAEPAARAYGRLALVFRLTPSTIRLSHKGTTGSPPIENHADAMVVVDKLVDNFLGKFTSAEQKPKFISPASHLENYLVDITSEDATDTPKLRITETDFEDFRELGSGQLPFVHAQTGQFVDTRHVLRDYFKNFTSLPHFDITQGEKDLKVLLQAKLEEEGIEIDFSTCEHIESIADAVWEQWILPIDYSERHRNHYAPEAMRSFVFSNNERLRSVIPMHEASIAREQENRMMIWQKYGHIDGIGALLNYASGYGTGIMPEPEEVGDVVTRADSGRSEIQNGMRRHFVRQIYKEQEELAQEMLQQTDLPEEVRNSVIDIMKSSRQEYEIVARIFGALEFFKEYIDSEIDYTGKCNLKAGHDQQYYKELLRLVKAITDEQYESTDGGIGIGFVMDIMPSLMQQLHQAAKKCFAGNM